MLLGVSILIGTSVFEALMLLYVIAIMFTFLFVAIVDAHITSHTTLQSFLRGGMAAVIVVIAGMIFISLYTSFNASYQKDSLDYWRVQTSELIKEYEETNDEIESNYILRFKVFPAYKKFDHYHLSLFGTSSKEFSKYFERKTLTVHGKTAVDYTVVEKENNTK
jgi:NADH:ubiquinone oxidoreductase subunit 6 (subunit J)